MEVHAFAWQKWQSVLKSEQWHGGHSEVESSNTCCARDFFPYQPPLPHQRTAGHRLRASLNWNSKSFRCRTDAHYWGSDLKGWCYISTNLGAVCWYREMVMSFDFHLRLLFCCVTDSRCLMEMYCVMSLVVTCGPNDHYIYNSDGGRYVLDHYSLSFLPPWLFLVYKCHNKILLLFTNMFCLCLWNVASCLRHSFTFTQFVSCHIHWF